MKKVSQFKTSLVAMAGLALLVFGLTGCDEAKKAQSAVPAPEVKKEAAAPAVTEQPAAPTAKANPAAAKPKDHPAH